MIERNFYLQQIISKMWDVNIKVITGIRRCGCMPISNTKGLI